MTGCVQTCLILRAFPKTESRRSGLQSCVGCFGNAGADCCLIRTNGEDWIVEVTHIGHGNNGVADRLAQQGRVLSMNLAFFSMVPDDVACLVEKEQLDSSPATVMSFTVEHEVSFDPGGHR
ncbi:hypothetical protein V6N11_080271 [Hibiscus sabdariffa]|uniref:RNase H type-1 domain-containing protein n=1 Tax=Hibiscus sabdariffa TaxID=183260 RepID=A0ABR2R761_9ROSI